MRTQLSTTRGVLLRLLREKLVEQGVVAVVNHLSGLYTVAKSTQPVLDMVIANAMERKISMWRMPSMNSVLVMSEVPWSQQSS